MRDTRETPCVRTTMRPPRQSAYPKVSKPRISRRPTSGSAASLKRTSTPPSTGAAIHWPLSTMSCCTGESLSKCRKRRARPGSNWGHWVAASNACCSSSVPARKRRWSNARRRRPTASSSVSSAPGPACATRAYRAPGTRSSTNWYRPGWTRAPTTVSRNTPRAQRCAATMSTSNPRETAPT